MYAIVVSAIATSASFDFLGYLSRHGCLKKRARPALRLDARLRVGDRRSMHALSLRRSLLALAFAALPSGAGFLDWQDLRSCL